MHQAFIEKNFRRSTLEIIDHANTIINEYQAQGFTLTLRQLYYQFVARDLLANTQRNYDRLGSIINNARLAGYVDWSAIEDRTRHLKTNWHALDPRQAIEAVRDSYGIDMWSNQQKRCEVWIEKNALIGVIADVCDELDVPYFACIGYVSQSEQWRAYRRHAAQQQTIIFHLGDHDPSGIDMTRDNQDRLDLFHGNHLQTEVVRLALNWNQIQQYSPPPNPAKSSDSRFEAYADLYGTDSWELDALEPKVMAQLIRDNVTALIDQTLWDERVQTLSDDLDTLNDIIYNL